MDWFLVGCCWMFEVVVESGGYVWVGIDRDIGDGDQCYWFCDIDIGDGKLVVEQIVLGCQMCFENVQWVVEFGDVNGGICVVVFVFIEQY